ncbi:P-type conjugative transfer protein TrbJ [Acidiphilium sp. PM]|uniref:P-type conjugative transfer protein TrbJ n=1 Tax=Acidiphilium sp. PM TaxID=1043206 RepID=UPI000A0161A4|nr:P-type conjugative transfer protein TrbJ [Acidiphilium sp. PM]
MRMKTFSRIALVASVVFAPVVARAGGGGFGGIAGATLPEQIIQEATSVSQLARQAQEVSNQLQQIRYQVQNLASLPQNLWSQTYGDLSSLTNIMSQANGLSYTMQNVNSAFQSQYPSYNSSENYNQLYKKWSQTTSNSIAAALQAQGFNANQFATQQSALNAIEQASQSATGRMQALQAGNQIAAMEVTQLQQLQQLQSANSDAQLAWIKQQQTQQAQQEQAGSQAWKNWNSYTLPPAQGQGYGAFSPP